MFGSGWCGGMSAGGWLLMALIWGSFLAVIVVKSMKKATYGCVAT